jgi:hypothetical protein
MMTESKKLPDIDPAIIAQLNVLFEQSFPGIDKRLNHFVVNTNMSEGHWLVPVVDVKPGTPTVPEVKDLEGAFTLNTPGAVTVEFQKVPSKTVIIRYLLSYEAALFAAKSKVSFNDIMHPVVRDMIEELREVKGFNEDTVSYGTSYGTFERPSGEVFNDNGESGGVEIRLFSDTSILVKDNK